MIRVPDAALSARSCRSDERLAAFIRLCASVAVAPGTYHAPGPAHVRRVPASLRAGEIVVTYDDLAELWSTSVPSARRTLAAFERDNLVSLRPAAIAAVGGEPASPVGTLVGVVGLGVRALPETAVDGLRPDPALKPPVAKKTQMGLGHHRG